MIGALTRGVTASGVVSWPRIVWAVVAASAFTLPIVWSLATADPIGEADTASLARASLLSYVWSGSTSTAFVWGVVAMMACLVLIGTLIVPMHEVPPASVGARRRGVFAGACGTGCIATAFAMSYALIVPPLQGPDEPDHLSGYAAVTGDASLVTAAFGWASVTHAARIQGRRDQRFRPSDIGHPWPTPIIINVPKTRSRSGLTTALWSLVGRVAAGGSVQRQFLAVRVVNVLIFGAAVALATALFGALTDVPYPQLLSAPFLLVPTLPFFGMHFGESALLTSVYVVGAAVIAILFLDHDRIHWTGVPLGLVSAALLVGARSSQPMLVAVGAVLMTRALIGFRHQSHARSRALVFWGGVGLGASSFSLLLTEPQLDRLLEAAAWLPRSLSPLVGWAVSAWFPMAAAAVACGAEIGLTGLRESTARTLRPMLIGATRSLPVAAAAAILASLAGSLWWRYPWIEGILRPDPPSLREYVWQVATGGATLFRARYPDFLLSSSFWTGFGWLDTIPPPVVTSSLVVLTGLSLICLLLHIARHQEVRRFVWLTSLMCGAAATLMVYAASVYRVEGNVHGRYLIGWYLSSLAVFWTFPALAPSGLVTRVLHSSGISRPAPFIGLSLALHSYSLCFILRRYF